MGLSSEGWRRLNIPSEEDSKDKHRETGKLGCS